MTDREQKLAWLKDARERMHELRTGQAAAVFVDQNGERVEYNKADMVGLKNYITELEVELGLRAVGGPFRAWM